MDILQLNDRPDIAADKKLSAAYSQLGALLAEIRKKELTAPVVQAVNQNIEKLNTSTLVGKALSKQLRVSQGSIIKTLEKEMKIVPKNHYRNTWMVVGMSAFGLPLGVAFGAAMKNMGLLGIGLPIGMAIGLAVGSGMDKKAEDEGRQLNIELKY